MSINNEGARSAESDLEQLAGPVETITKNKCRVFWTAPLEAPRDRVLTGSVAGAGCSEAGGGAERFLSRPGVFAWDRIDVASRLLAEQFPADLGGEAADLGAGFGYLSAELLARTTRLTALHLYEAEGRALELAKKNVAPLAG